MRIGAVISAGLVLVLAGFMAPAPAPAVAEQPEPTGPGDTKLVPSVFNTFQVLRDQGFNSVEVGYPAGTNSVVVHFAPPPALSTPGVTDSISNAVWAHEPRFDVLNIEAGGDTATLSFEQLTSQLGSRPVELERVSVSGMQQLARIGPAIDKSLGRSGSATSITAFWAVVVIFGAMGGVAVVLLTIAFVIRRFTREPDRRAINSREPK
jgi:hypothetical protein